MDPAERITTEEAMMHPYFDGVREQYDKEDTARKPLSSGIDTKRESALLKKNVSIDQHILISNNNLRQDNTD